MSNYLYLYYYFGFVLAPRCYIFTRSMMHLNDGHMDSDFARMTFYWQSSGIE